MSRSIRQRGTDPRPLYARTLRLDYLQLGGVACMFLFEGMIVLAALLSMAGLVSWWSLLILPVTVAVLVKINDAVVTVVGRSKVGRRLRLARGVARVKDPREEMPTMLIPIVKPRQTWLWADDARRLAVTAALRHHDLRPRRAAIGLGQGAPTDPI